MIRNGTGRDAFALHTLPPEAQLPGTRGLRLCARGFFAHAHAAFGWTDADALAALERFSDRSDIPFAVDRAFCPPSCASPHGSGVCFDVGTALSPRERDALRCAAIQSGLFHRVGPEVESPRCVRLTCLPRPAVLRPGDAGVYVFVLQHALRDFGVYAGADTGYFCNMTARAVHAAQNALGLPKTGIVRAPLWHAIGRR